MTPSEVFDLDRTFALLADTQRRRILYRLLDTEYATVESLSRGLAAAEAETTVRAVSDEAADQVGIALVHEHLPRLADCGVVDFDARSGDVVTASSFEALEPFLERARTLEDSTEPADPSVLSALYSEPPEERYLSEQP